MSDQIRIRCSACKPAFRSIEISDGSGFKCRACGFTMAVDRGIVRCLTPERAASFQSFNRNYQAVREKEGWGSANPDYYLALPFRDLSGQHTWIWRIRAQTLRYMQRNILPQAHGRAPVGCRILDIGAGNCWLSHRLSQRGYSPVAVDLATDDVDGLGAARHYLAHIRHGFPRFQAEMDNLPFDSAQFDVVIFNASFHYSSDYERSLREAMRCLRSPGIVVVADSPFYRRRESGQQMLEERRKSFELQCGVQDDGIQHCEYLTSQTLRELEQSLGIRWNVGKPWYGMQWALRPAKAWFLRRREPSKFYLLWFRTN